MTEIIGWAFSLCLLAAIIYWVILGWFIIHEVTWAIVRWWRS